MNKKQLKIIGIIVLLIVALILAVGSWRQKVLLSEKTLNEAIVTIEGVIDYRHTIIKDVVEILVQEPNVDPGVRELSVYLRSVKETVPYAAALRDINEHEALLSREQQLTKTVKELLKYSHRKPFIWKNPNYRMKVRQLYYVSLQLYNIQHKINEESRYFNEKITGILEGTLNKIFFNYQPVIPLGEIVGRDIAQYHQYTLMPVERQRPAS